MANKWKWNFTPEEKEYTQVYNQAIRDRISKLRELEKPYAVIIEEFKKDKTLSQLAGIHKLFTIIAADFSKEAGKIVSVETVKTLIKDEYGLFDIVELGGKKIKQYRSLRESALQEMQAIIEFTQSWALTEWGIKDCVLTSVEQRALIEYYDDKKNI